MMKFTSPDIANLALIALLGLVVGSFLNVLIFRGPAIWKLIEPEHPRGSLWGPRSQCPSCNSQIKSWHNIPLLSYLILKGQCADCSAKIPLRYPVVEALGALAAIISVALFGWNLSALVAALYLWTLIVLGAIDFETGYLPDALTLPLIALGLLVNAIGSIGGFASRPEAFIGAIAGYGSFWLIAFYYERIRGREGLGMGDAKLLAALGAWCGWPALAPIVLIASVGALGFVGFAAIRGKNVEADTLIRFGPALALAGIIVFVAQAWPEQGAHFALGG